MSMNRYMHPRNIYKCPPNFKQLAIDYPEFRNHVEQDVTGKISINFKDVSALRALTRTLLLKDFSLDVEVPVNKLIPTVPLRLNYILWIEDLLSICERIGEIKGIDIGSGASGVYPLLAAKKNQWRMIGTEIDKGSVECAQRNVGRNKLDQLISIKQVQGDTLLLEVVSVDCSERYDFCMCNPPFFGSTQELNYFFKSRKESRPRPRNAFCATVGEVVSSGGEVEFITKLIQESKMLNERISIYTTMVGQKSSLAPLKKLLREASVVSFKQTEFCQGHTTRWGLAWTFLDIDLRKVPEDTLVAARKSKAKQPFKYVLSDKERSTPLDISEVARCIGKIFHELLIHLEQIKGSKNVFAYNFTAQRNTWSHQRRKRREKKNLSKLLDGSCDGDSSVSSEVQNQSSTSDDSRMDTSSTEVIADNKQAASVPENSSCVCKRISTPDLENALNKLAEVKVNSPGSMKRELEEDDCEDYYQFKKSKPMDVSCQCTQNELYLKAMLVIRRENTEVHVELSRIEGTENREVLHQIMQYIKNNLKFKECKT